MHKPNIALTMGDPAGVGPELALRALASDEFRNVCNLVVVGNAEILHRCADTTGLPQADVKILSPAQFLSRRVAAASVVDVSFPNLARFSSSQASADCGQAAFDYIQIAIDAALAGHVDAITTAPINKEALRAAGIHFPGHTEMFAERATAERFCMLQYSAEITCAFVTVHVGYSEVPALITARRVLDTIELTHAALLKLRGKPPHLVVCGLNPHAGEHGLFGNCEEEEHIQPAIDEARRQGISIEGPIPPDTAFLPAKRRTTDAFICMYHDQGHIPLKALAFDSAVNTTLGLSIVRTSVDHGTAFDIAWQGIASPNSLFAAIRLAAQLVG